MSAQAGLAPLIELALRQRQLAYAPYSSFAVGAALESSDGKTFSGCNVENASYGLSICAERAAVFQAVAGGMRELRRIVVAAHPLVSPCGACRQVLAEFATPETTVISVDADNPASIREWTIEQLLPDQFRLGK